ncbi:MAG: tRNA pseudouridine(55) synthase TruB [Anaerovoracaceae bacterium]
MKDGILILNKPQNWTSHDCVAVCRRAADRKKTGHGGTLDPMAEGLLPVFIGKATRIMEYLDLDYKTYECRARLGTVTDTQDIWGQVLKTCDTGGISCGDIEKALMSFEGHIQQVPPGYSAVKLNGKKLYEYARAGEDVKVKPRDVHIEHIRINDVDMDAMEVSFEVKCSKGTYVRTICSDLGDALGCGGTLVSLKRTASGIFDLSRSVSPEDLKTMSGEEIDEHIIPTDRPLVNMGKVTMNADRTVYFSRGNSIRWYQVNKESDPPYKGERKNNRGIPYSNLYRVYQSETGEFLGTGYHDRKEKVLKADKIFVARQ